MVRSHDRSTWGGRWRRCAWLAWLCLCAFLCSEAAARRRPRLAKPGPAASVNGTQKGTLSARPSRIEPPPMGEPGAPDLVGLLHTLEGEYRHSPSPELLYELGVLASLTGRVVEAQDLMRRFLADPLSVPGSPGWADAEAALAGARPPAGEVQVSADDEGLVQVDERWIGALPLPLPLLLPVGRHQIVVEMHGKTMRTRVDVKDGRTVALRFNRESGAVVATLPPAVILVPYTTGLPNRADLGRRIEETTAKALQKARLAWYDRGAALRKEPQLLDCLSTLECQAQLARRSDVEYTLPLSLSFAALPTGDEYTARLSLVDAEVGAVAAERTFSCPRCTVEQLLGQLSDVLSQLIKAGAGRARGTLSIASTPAGAVVREGERRLGQTPFEHSAFVGPHALTLSLPGHQTEQLTLSVVDGKRATAQVMLAPTPVALPPVVVASPAAPPPSLRRPIWRWAVGGIAVGLGLGLVGVGTSGIAIDGQCVSPPELPVINCRDRFDTLGKGAVLLGVGAGLSLAGVIILALPPRRGEPGVRARSALLGPIDGSMQQGHAGPLPGLVVGRE